MEVVGCDLLGVVTIGSLCGLSARRHELGFRDLRHSLGELNLGVGSGMYMSGEASEVDVFELN